MNRRHFIRNIGITTSAFVGAGLFRTGTARAAPQTLSWNGSWEDVRKYFNLEPGLINLNNGVSPSLIAVTDKYREMLEYSSLYPMDNEMTVAEMAIATKGKVANFLNVNPETLALLRSTTEGIQTIISGLDICEGDEILTTNLEYSSLNEALDLKKIKNKVTITKIEIPFMANDDEILEKFRQNISSKTKLVIVSHMTFRAGRIMPVKQIIKLAHELNTEILVDGAHALGQFEFDLVDLDCDYYAGGFHKWLCGPLGAGFLYIKKDKIEKMWPMFGQVDLEGKTAEKFENAYSYGTTAHVAIEPALDFHRELGPKNRENYLRSIKNKIAGELAQFQNIDFLTPLNENQSCAMMAIRIKGHDVIEIQKTLREKFHIAVAVHKRNDEPTMRIAPNIYTSTEDIFIFINAMASLLKK